jgi:hypothetical protein
MPDPIRSVHPAYVQAAHFRSGIGYKTGILIPRPCVQRNPAFGVPAWCRLFCRRILWIGNTGNKEYPSMLKPIRRLANALKGKTREEREFAYLSEACDLVDLEYRQRQIDRGLFGAR